MPELLMGSVSAGVPLLGVSVLGLWSTIWPYLVMVLGFSLIIFVHELGHFVAAKWAGVRVDRFAIGFGRELFGFTRGETRYSFNVLPVGGYVKMLGQEDFDDKSEELKFKNDPSSFVNKSVGKRAVIVSAGVVMNVLCAFVLFLIVFLIGMQSVAPRIGWVEPDSPADKAGLLPGDLMLKVNDQKAYEFTDVNMAIVLAPPHEPIKFLIERKGEVLPPLYVKSEYYLPESAQEVRRQIVGILPGATRRIVAVGADVDPNNPRHPRVGDLLVEVAGQPVTDENVNEMLPLVVQGKGGVYVERPDPAQPGAPPQRVPIDIPPVMALYPADRDDPSSRHLLGLTPLVRIAAITPRGRADLAGIESGDTVLSWADQPYPTEAEIVQAVADSPERDLAVVLQKGNGQIVSTFVRPKLNRRGAGTIGATVSGVDAAIPAAAATVPSDQTGGQAPLVSPPRAKFATVRPHGVAARAGIGPGDEILEFAGVESPSAAQVHRLIEQNRDTSLLVAVRRPEGQVMWTSVTPASPGSIGATFGLVAQDVLRVGQIARLSAGRPTPAAEAGIPPGALLEAVDDEPVKSWSELVDQFRRRAGSTIQLAYRDARHARHVVPFRVPASLQTLLEVGPESRIVRINGASTVKIATERGAEAVSVAYPDATRAALRTMVGQRVSVDYRPSLVAPVQTGHVDVTEDMLDPWLGRVVLQTNVLTEPEPTLLKGDNALDALWIGVHKTHYFVLQVYTVISRMVFSRSVGVDTLSGPLGIMEMGGRIARADTVKFLFFLAIISANLAVINFLPLPIVDGGLMVFLIIEKIKGSPVSLRVQVATQLIGLFLIIGAFVYVTFNDLLRIWG
ncbi:MAG TPA: RIP metalloprotease RseP [Phycisphaerae bacterium]|nr:RIP metalloprotease RseP [Phycisphaerae bacterium]HNU47051.1 RIP metalloprotease RseP [Phycisphaerae bacterium]